MHENDNCSGCAQHHDCKSMYKALGDAEGTFVATRSIAAFLVPIVIFALGLAVFDKLLVEKITGNSARTLACAFLALLICSIYVMALRFILNRRTSCKNACITKFEGDEKSK